MGCDIHLFVEYKEKETANWYSFGGEFRLNRNYMMFGLLAEGVRMDFDEGVAMELKGRPEDPSHTVKYADVYYIDSDDERLTCSLEKAQSWAAHGCKIHYLGNSDRPYTVDNPDHHSHSWLTLDEFERQILLFQTKSPYKSEDYEAVLSAMKCLAKFGNDVRVVFWFDN